ERVNHLLGDRVLVERDRDSPKALRRGHGPVEPRAVVADDREPVAAPEAPGRETAGERPDLAGDLRPRPALPDAEVLLAHGRPAAADAGVFQQELRKRVGRAGAL